MYGRNVLTKDITVYFFFLNSLPKSRKLRILVCEVTGEKSLFNKERLFVLTRIESSRTSVTMDEIVVKRVPICQIEFIGVS